MSLWIDKYRPKSLQELTYHTEQAQNVKNMVQKLDFPHMIVYGPSGAGKATRVHCIVKEIYGDGVEKIKLDQASFTTNSGKKIELNIISSTYHIEVNPSEAGLNDRLVIQDLIKRTAQSIQLNSFTQKPFKTVVINEADKLSREAQHALRRTMEKYAHSCRLILVAESLSPIIQAVQSRCLCYRVPLPSVDMVVQVLQDICKKQNLNITSELASRIAAVAECNLRRAILMCQNCYSQRYPFTHDQNIDIPEWEIYLKLVATNIMQNQSSQEISNIRKMLYQLLTKCIPPSIILQKLLDELLTYSDDNFKLKLIEIAAQKEATMKTGSKPIFHLEAFVVHFMSIYTSYIKEGILE